MRSLRAFQYVLVRGLRGMAQAPMVQLLAVTTTAVCMLLLCTMMLVWTNAQGMAAAWGVDVPLTVYLEDGADQEQVDELRTRVAALDEVATVDYVTPQQAMQRLADGLGGDEGLLEGLQPEILPASLEVRLLGGTPAEFGPALANRIAAFEAVEEVAVAGEWVAKADAMLNTLGDLALGAAALVGFACMAIVWSTIRLAVYARRSEIQILRLVGGTRAFVQGPFVIEGVLQGALGAAVALGLLYAGFDALVPFLENGLSLVFAAGSLHFFSPGQVAVGIGFGAAVGLVGSRAAAGRYLEV